MDQDVLNLTSYTTQRCKEFYVLTHPEVIKFFEDHHIERISFKDL